MVGHIWSSLWLDVVGCGWPWWVMFSHDWLWLALMGRGTVGGYNTVGLLVMLTVTSVPFGHSWPRLVLVTYGKSLLAMVTPLTLLLH